MSRWSKQIEKRLIEARTKGHTLEQCAKLVGIAPRTLDSWIAKAKKGQQPYQSFYRRFEAARQVTCSILLENLVQQALEGNTGASFFLLERVYGFTRDGPPPLQINIEADNVDVKTLINEYNTGFKALIDGPQIDLDEE